MIGLVLAGGKSSRLGQDKTAVVHQGQTLLQRSAALLGRHCDQVYISCRNPQTVPPDLTPLVDQTERIGPAGGIITALRSLGGPIFALACDLPFMQDRLILSLLAARRSKPAHCVMTTWQQPESDFIEALVAIYEAESLPFLEAGVASGLFKLSRLVPADRRHCIIYDQADQRCFFNVNYPQDLQTLTADRNQTGSF